MRHRPSKSCQSFRRAEALAIEAASEESSIEIEEVNGMPADSPKLETVKEVDLSDEWANMLEEPEAAAEVAAAPAAPAAADSAVEEFSISKRRPQRPLLNQHPSRSLQRRRMSRKNSTFRWKGLRLENSGSRRRSGARSGRARCRGARRDSICDRRRRAGTRDGRSRARGSGSRDACCACREDPAACAKGARARIGIRARSGLRTRARSRAACSGSRSASARRSDCREALRA